MKNLQLTSFILFMSVLCGCTVAEKTKPMSSEMQPQQIKDFMTKAADWQLANPGQHPTADWTYGALFAGLTAWAQMADTDTYYDALLEFGEKNNWQPSLRGYHADDYAVGQMYLDLYKKYKDPRMIYSIQKKLDAILANPPKSQMKTGREDIQDRWNWCDALFMGPPVWAKLARITEQQKYLDFMNTEWWVSTDYLYDKDEHLYYRDSRYFDRREANGEKILWSRGNGWVLGGLVRVLEELDDDHPGRDKYETLYRQMASKLIAIQPKEGLWHPSLLDPLSFPNQESSGSGFFCYGLAWGLNHGLLDAKTALPAIVKAWTGLVNCVQADGKLGYVQPIGADPRHVTADQTEIYGVGAFLLAGSEVYKIAIRGDAEVKQLVLTNPIQSFRDSQTIQLNWDDLKGAVSGLTKDNAAVFDFKTNRLLVTQVVEDGAKTELLFQVDFAPGEKRYFWIMKQPSMLEKPKSNLTTYCRFVPERKDDFAWENDKVAFRMYGPALEDETITCGIDAWGKCVQIPVVDQFYKTGDYHANHGQGGDFYTVGNTLGCGGAAPFVNGKICLPPRNFVTWKIITNGPIRSVFELSYAPWKAGEMTIRETKRISIDLGSSLNKVDCFYLSDDTQSVPVAAGIVLQDSSRQTYKHTANIIAYWLPANSNNGGMGCGVVFSSDIQSNTVQIKGHLLMKTDHLTAKPLVYYSGSCWDGGRDFKTFQQWLRYLDEFQRRIDHPVQIKMVQ